MRTHSGKIAQKCAADENEAVLWLDMLADGFDGIVVFFSDGLEQHQVKNRENG
jgi:hypothetical protein